MPRQPRSLVSAYTAAWLCAQMLAMSAGWAKGETAATRPDGADAAALRSRISSLPLQLSTEGDSASKNFCFQLRMDLPAEHGVRRGNAVVVRKGNQVALFIREGESGGLPVWYMTDGLAVGVDAEHPGGLIVSTGGAPRFVFTE